MDLSVIENDPTEVKKYLQNFIPINYYRVLGDEYLYQVRATLLQSTSLAGLYNPKYDKLINDLVVETAGNYGRINTTLDVMSSLLSAQAIRTDIVEVEAANANASILTIQEANASQNRAQAEINERLEASLDDIVVGGRNIMKNSDFSKGYRAWQESSITVHDHFIGTMHKISSTGIVGSLMGIYPLAEYQNMAMVEGTQYSISFYAYGSILLMDEIYLTSASEAPIKLPSVVISTDLSKRRHITFKAPTGGGGLGLIFGATATSKDDWFSISRIKVELGNKPSDWTPAPEDVEGYIAEVQSTIDTFKDIQVERNLVTATSLEMLDSRVKNNQATILAETSTRVDQHSAQAIINTELESKTNGNTARIKDVDETLTGRFESSSSRISTLEAETRASKGKIDNLESVTTDLGGVVVQQGSTLTARIDNLNVGGRNLLRNSDFKLGVDTWGTSAITKTKSIVGNLTTVTNTGTTANYFGLTPINIFKTVTLIKDKEYVLSFYAKGNIPSINDIWITTEGELPQQLNNVPITDGISDRYSTVFIANHTTEVGSIIIGASGYGKDKWFSVAGTKLEIGNKSTDWTNAPEDTSESIEKVEANIEAYKKAQALTNLAITEDYNKLDASVGLNKGEIEKIDKLVITNTEAIGTINNKLEVGIGEDIAQILDDYKVVSNKVDNVYTQINPTMLGSTEILIGNNEKLIGEWSETSARIEEDLITATRLNTVQTELNGNTSKIEMLSESINGVSAKWSVKLNVNGYVTGLSHFNLGDTSGITFTTDAFRIASPSGGSNQIFSIVGSNTYIENVKIKYGQIEDVVIKLAQIDTGSITNLSSLSANLGNITGGSIKIGSNFSVTNTGVLTATSGNFTGVINATSGNFTGVVNATSGNFTGTVNATSGSFKGAITASTININNRFKVDSLGNMTATSGTFSGNITGSTGVFGGLVSGLVSGGSININDKFTVNSSGDLIAKSGTFEGTVLAEKIQGTIDIASMKKSAWMPAWEIFYHPQQLWSTPNNFDKTYSGSLGSQGAIDAYYAGDGSFEMTSVMFEVKVFCVRATVVKQRVILCDDFAYVWVNGSKVRQFSNAQRGTLIEYSLKQGTNLIQIILTNDYGGATGLVLAGNFIDNVNVKFA